MEVPLFFDFLQHFPFAFLLSFSLYSIPAPVVFPATLATLLPRFEGTPDGVGACYTVRQERQDRKTVCIRGLCPVRLSSDDRTGRLRAVKKQKKNRWNGAQNGL